MKPVISPNAALERAIEHFGSLSAMARALGLSGYQVIQEWRRQGRVPAEHCPNIEDVTGEMCEDLNDKIPWAKVRNSRFSAPSSKAQAAA